MSEVLASYVASYNDNPQDTYLSAILSLEDRILVLQRQRQKFGTQWAPDKNGKLFLFPVADFDSLNKRRAIYGLGPLVRPVDLSQPSSSAAIREPAAINDQKEPTEEEYLAFAQEYLD